MMGEDDLDEIKHILQDACDRQWEDESLFATANIAANGLYWRGKEIERQREQIAELLATLEKIDALGNGLFMQEDEAGLTSYATLMRCGSIARAALKVSA